MTTTTDRLATEGVGPRAAAGSGSGAGSGTGVLAAVSAAVESLAAGDASRCWQLFDGDVTGALGLVGTARQLLEAVEVALVREGVTRGLPDEAGRSPHDWVTLSEGVRAPQPDPREVARVLRVAGAGRRGVRPAVESVVEAFAAGDFSLASADQLVRFEGEVAPVADPEMLDADLRILLEAARDDRPGHDGGERRAGLTGRQLRAAIVRTGRMLRPERDLESEERQARAARGLYKSSGPAGLSTYRLVLDPEGAAIVDAAVAALSAPVPDADGAPDERTAAHRRADALLDVVGRGVSASTSEPGGPRTQLMVTLPWSTLREEIDQAGAAGGFGGGGSTRCPTQQGCGAGTTATGDVLSPGVVRRLACDADVVPVVLGGPGEVLELGRARRLFSVGQRRAIWLRDQGCTYPGCTIPAQWCDAHHVRWWSRGGATDVANAALLCQRHHTRVHQRDLTATVTSTGVTWHL